MQPEKVMSLTLQHICMWSKKKLQNTDTVELLHHCYITARVIQNVIMTPMDDEFLIQK